MKTSSFAVVKRRRSAPGTTKMRWDTTLRVAGMISVVGSYLVFAKVGTEVTALTVVVAAILALVGPEVVDAFPFGPTKD